MWSEDLTSHFEVKGTEDRIVEAYFINKLSRELEGWRRKYEA